MCLSSFPLPPIELKKYQETKKVDLLGNTLQSTRLQDSPSHHNYQGPHSFKKTHVFN